MLAAVRKDGRGGVDARASITVAVEKLDAVKVSDGGGGSRNGGAIDSTGGRGAES